MRQVPDAVLHVVDGLDAAVEQFEEEPDADDPDGADGQPAGINETAELQPVRGEEEEIHPQHAEDGTGRADARDDRFREKQHVARRAAEAAEQVRQQVRQGPAAPLDTRAEKIQEEHVAQQVQQIGVQEQHPFNAVIGFSNLLRENINEFDIKEISEYIGYINDSAIHAYTLLGNLLDWASSQTNNIRFKPGAVNISDIINAILLILSGEASKKNISISNTVPALFVVFADSNMVSTVFRNLVSNAIKFTRPGGMITISSHPTEGYNEFTVADNGVGIQKKDIENMFRIDTKINTRGTAQEPGTGLGLILCKEFIEKNSGTIRVESEPGIGSRFTFTLPSVSG